MTKPLTPLATLFHRHPLPRALHSRCTVVMTVCVSCELQAPKLHAGTGQAGPAGVEAVGEGFTVLGSSGERGPTSGKGL